MTSCARRFVGSSDKMHKSNKLIVNPLLFIAVGCKGEYLVIAVQGTIDAVVDGAVIVDASSDIVVVMPIDAAYQAGEL